MIVAAAAAGCEAAVSCTLQHAQSRDIAQHAWDEEGDSHHTEHDYAGPVKHMGCKGTPAGDQQ
jgi:hypothetical protein